MKYKTAVLLFLILSTSTSGDVDVTAALCQVRHADNIIVMMERARVGPMPYYKIQYIEGRNLTIVGVET